MGNLSSKNTQGRNIYNVPNKSSWKQLLNMDSEVWKKLPEDCWIPILNAVDDYRYLKYLSLVSRQFLSVTNHLRRSLTITDKVIPSLPNLLCRFPNIDEINIRKFHGDLDVLLRQISASNILLRSISLPEDKHLPIVGLRRLGSKMGSTLRVLNCSAMSDFKDYDLVTIANTFPFLEELDISDVSFSQDDKYLSDAGIRRMSEGLKELRKINLSGNWFLTDESIISLSSNCLLLRELDIRQCRFTVKGIEKALLDCHHLNSSSAILYSFTAHEYFSNSLAYPTHLRDLDLSFRYVSSSIADGFLSGLAKANLPPEKLKITAEYGTYKRRSSLLQNYSCLKVRRSDFLTDENVAEMSKFLKNITYINLSHCHELTSAAFFTIIKSCPFLTNFEMQSTNVEGIEEFETKFAVNHQVKDLGLTNNYMMCDEFVKKIAFTCPNLQNLSLSGCRRITAEGINTVLRNCHGIKQLNINWCYSVSKFNINIALPNLEDLRARGLELDDKSLEIIGERCSGLLCLDLAFCPNVSGNGVMKVAKKCRNLRNINLRWCDGIHSDTISSLISSRPSLRKITPPFGKNHS